MENQPEPINQEIVIRGYKLLFPALLPFLSETDANREVQKRNENQRETNKPKAIQKRLEEVFGSGLFHSADRLLDDWLYLILDDAGNLILQDEDGSYISSAGEIFPILFKKFNQATQLVVDPKVQGQANLFYVPEFGKHKTLIKAINDYDSNRGLLIAISNTTRSAVA